MSNAELLARLLLFQCKLLIRIIKNQKSLREYDEINIDDQIKEFNQLIKEIGE